MTEVKEFQNSVYDRTEATFQPKDFIHLFNNTMQWKELEKEIGGVLRPIYDDLFGRDMKLIDKLHDIVQHRDYAVNELKKYYYKTNKSLYTITIIINGYLK
jgi:hypothetical protein